MAIDLSRVKSWLTELSPESVEYSWNIVSHAVSPPTNSVSPFTKQRTKIAIGKVAHVYEIGFAGSGFLNKANIIIKLY